MQQQTPPSHEQVWGAPQSRPKGWTAQKTLAAVGIASAIAVLGGGVIYAASQASGTNGPGGGPGGGPGMSMNGGGPGMGTNGGTGGAAGPAASLHGEFVVSDGNGGYTTEITQTGTVTAASSTSVTAKSADDYSRTYAIASNTSSSDIAVGDTVSIRGTESNGTATLVSITEGTAASGGAGMGGPGGAGMGAPGATQRTTGN